MKKSVIVSVLTVVIMLIPSVTFAGTEPALSDADVIVLDDGYYIETVIEDEDSGLLTIMHNAISRSKGSTTTKTKSKTTYIKNSSGNVMWYVKVTGTFTYGNGSAKCTKSVCTAESKDKTWKVSNKSSSKSGNKASATAKGTHYLNGAPLESITRTVTLTCSPTGNFS